MSQARRKTRCAGGGHRSELVCLSFSVGRSLSICAREEKKRGRTDGLQGYEAMGHVTIPTNKMVNTFGKVGRAMEYSLENALNF